MNQLKSDNKLLELCVTGMDQALFHRHKSKDIFSPFMITCKDGDQKIVNLLGEGKDATPAFIDILKNDPVVYDQFVFCQEGIVREQGEKFDAVFVKGFDSSEPNGLILYQKFRGIDSGQPFKKLGKPVLRSSTEPIPIAVTGRTTNKISEEPFISVISSNGDKNIMVYHDNPSMLSDPLAATVNKILESADSKFSGTINLIFNSDVMPSGDFVNFVLNNLRDELEALPSSKKWQQNSNKDLSLNINFHGSGQEQTRTLPSPSKNRKPKKKKSKNWKTFLALFNILLIAGAGYYGLNKMYSIANREYSPPGPLARKLNLDYRSLMRVPDNRENYPAYDLYHRFSNNNELSLDNNSIVKYHSSIRDSSLLVLMQISEIDDLTDIEKGKVVLATNNALDSLDYLFGYRRYIAFYSTKDRKPKIVVTPEQVYYDEIPLPELYKFYRDE